VQRCAETCTGQDAHGNSSAVEKRRHVSGQDARCGFPPVRVPRTHAWVGDLLLQFPAPND
jgi:hypothetical protein